MSILKGAFTVSFITLISRISGYARDVFVSAHLGTGIAADIFVVMLRLPNLFRTLFGEGALNISFIPLYSEFLATKGKSSAQHVAAITQAILSLVLIGFCATLYIMMPEFVSVTTPGFSDDPGVIETITRLTRITISYLAFISLVAFYGGILNSHGKYAAFALAPIIMNICIIIATMCEGYVDMSMLDILAYAIAISGALELLWMVCVAKKYDLAPGFARIEITPEIKEFFSRILPGIVGSGVWQINSWVEMMIISSVPGGMSLLYYADRINQLPLALVGTALGTVMMPLLAKSYAQKDMISIQRHKSMAIELSLLLALPAAAGIFMLAHPIISILFENGAFTAESSVKSAAALSIFAFALPAQIISKIFLSSFYASGDTKTPVKVAAFSIAINISIALLLIDEMKHLGMAWASVCSAWSNIVISYIILHNRRMFTITKPLLWKSFRISICSLLMIWAIIMVKVVDVRPILSLVLCIASGGMIYVVSCLMMGVIGKREMSRYLKH